jgi:hypothetical protein
MALPTKIVQANEKNWLKAQPWKGLVDGNCSFKYQMRKVSAIKGL